MSTEEKSPYYSKRMRIADVKSPKELIGFKERTLEVTIGNTDAPTVAHDPKDLMSIKDANMKQMFLDMFQISDELATERKFKFIDGITEKK